MEAIVAVSALGVCEGMIGIYVGLERFAFALDGEYEGGCGAACYGAARTCFDWKTLDWLRV